MALPKFRKLSPDEWNAFQGLMPFGPTDGEEHMGHAYVGEVAGHTLMLVDRTGISVVFQFGLANLEPIVWWLELGKSVPVWYRVEQARLLLKLMQIESHVSLGELGFVQQV